MMQFVHKSAKSGAKGESIATPFVCWWYCVLNCMAIVLVVQGPHYMLFLRKKFFVVLIRREHFQTYQLYACFYRMQQNNLLVKPTEYSQKITNAQYHSDVIRNGHQPALLLPAETEEEFNTAGCYFFELFISKRTS